MLSLFPGILFLAPLGTALLRVVAGLYFIYAAYGMMAAKDELRSGRFPLVGHPAEWMVLGGALGTFVIGVLLVVGLWTQVAAILGALGALKFAAYVRWYEPALPLSSATGILLFVICLTLIVSGPGLFAFDLPL